MDQNTGSILDIIREQTSNIEQYTNSNLTTKAISETLKEFAHKERITRESTITIRNLENFSLDSVATIIEKEWTGEKEQAPATFWQDKTHTFVEFINPEAKRAFLTFVKERHHTNPAKDKLMEMIMQPNSLGHNFTRKEVKLEITGVRANIKHELIEGLLKKMAKPDTSISAIKEGKLHGMQTKMRSLMFKVNANGFNLIYNDLHGIIPYNNLDTSTKIRLYPRVNCKPWNCRDCFFIGPNHKCEGRACAQCGNKGHSTKDCKSKTRYCTNCRKKGHRAKDAHCPIYIREVVKEIKRMDIPLEFLEDDTKRFDLVKTLYYK